MVGKSERRLVILFGEKMIFSDLLLLIWCCLSQVYSIDPLNCNFHNICHPYNSSWWNYHAKYCKQCPPDKVYHCARDLDSPSVFKEGCAVAKICAAGEEPYLFFNQSLQKFDEPTVVCRNCSDENYYNEVDRKSYTFSSCPDKKMNNCSEGTRKILCEPDTSRSERFCRCDARNGYYPVNDSSHEICSYKNYDCKNYECPKLPNGESQQRLLNYTCAKKCPQGFGRLREDSDMCEQIIETTPLIITSTDYSEKRVSENETLLTAILIVVGMCTIIIICLYTIVSQRRMDNSIPDFKSDIEHIPLHALNADRNSVVKKQRPLYDQPSRVLFSDLSLQSTPLLDEENITTQLVLERKLGENQGLQKVTAEQHRKIADFESQVAQLEMHNVGLQCPMDKDAPSQTVLEKKLGENQGLQKVTAEQHRKIADLESQVAKLEMVLEKKLGENQGLQKVTAEQHRKIADLESQVAKLEMVLDRKLGENQGLQKVTAEQHRKIADFESQVAQLEMDSETKLDENRGLQKVMSEKITNLEIQVAKLTVDLKDEAFRCTIQEKFTIQAIKHRDGHLIKYGATTLLTKGCFHSFGTEVLNYGLENQIFIADDMDNCSKFAKEGDSGSLVFCVSDEDLVAVGLLFGGDKGYTLVTPLSDALHALGFSSPYCLKRFSDVNDKITEINIFFPKGKFDVHINDMIGQCPPPSKTIHIMYRNGALTIFLESQEYRQQVILNCLLTCQDMRTEFLQKDDDSIKYAVFEGYYTHQSFQSLLLKRLLLDFDATVKLSKPLSLTAALVIGIHTALTIQRGSRVSFIDKVLLIRPSRQGISMDIDTFNEWMDMLEIIFLANNRRDLMARFQLHMAKRSDTNLTKNKRATNEHLLLINDNFRSNGDERIEWCL